MRMKFNTYHLETFGCQMNVLDSQLIAAQLREMGLQPHPTPEGADIILFNTCSVRQHAEDKVLSRLGRLRTLKRRKPEVIIGVIGCMAERAREELFARVPHLDLLCGPGELHRLTGLIREVAERREHVMALSQSQSRRTPAAERSHWDDPLEALDGSRQPEPGQNVLQAYVRVQRGCDKFCTYCIVPFVRGPERSRPPENILAEVRALVAKGCREVTLLGQTVNSYAFREGSRTVIFARLLEQVAAIEHLDRVRFVTSFPADWDEDIFRVIRDNQRICPYLHLPAQSGSDRILRAMKRGYTVGEYLRLVDLARRYIPDIALAGDFIVGFCGETEEDFQATVDLVRRVQYKSLFVFKYSPRPGTAADRAQADDVPREVKVRRNNELLAVQAEISLRQKEALVGRRVEVLVEGYSKVGRRLSDLESEQSDGLPQGCLHEPEPAGLPAGERQLVGRTPHDLIAVFDGGPEYVGSIVNVAVESVSALTLFGRIVEVVSPPRRL
jgi:tRNA-2-methylthio-N6-dimethylallyladenosine synthase